MTGHEILKAKHVQEAIQIMHSFNSELKKITPKEILKQLNLFGYQEINALLETGSEEEALRLIDESAYVIIKFGENLEGKRHQIQWGESKKKMIDELRPNFAEWFAKAEKTVEIEQLNSRMSNKIESTGRDVKRFVSALIKNEAEAKEKKEEIKELYDGIASEIAELTELSLQQKHLLLSKINESISIAYSFVEEKLAEKPVHLLYYRSGRKAMVKVNINKSSYTYTIGRKREVRFSKQDDREQFPLIVSVNYIEEFLHQNKVRDEDIFVDPKSIEQFYTYSNQISVNLTPGFVSEWYNYDTPFLKRHVVNKHRHTTMLGMPICHFSHTLVESSWSADYISEDITEEEAGKLSKGYEHTRITNEINNVLRARKAKESGEIEEIKQFVHEYDARVQHIIDVYKNDILHALATKFGTISQLKTGTDDQVTLSINDNEFGFDCGFLYISSADREYTDKRSVLSKASDSESKWMKLQLPYWSQSTTVMKEQFNIVKDIVKSQLNVQLYGHTVLD